MIRISTGLANLVLKALGKSFADALKNGVIQIFTGPQPVSANEAESGTLLCTISRNGDLFIAYSTYGGINLQTAAGGVLAKAQSEIWTGKVLVDGVCSWFRHYDNTLTTGHSTTAVRYDGAIGTLGAGDLNMSHLDVLKDGKIEISSFSVIQPLL